MHSDESDTSSVDEEEGLFDDDDWSENDIEDERPGPGGDGPAGHGPWIRLMDPGDFQPRIDVDFIGPTGPINPPR